MSTDITALEARLIRLESAVQASMQAHMATLEELRAAIIARDNAVQDIKDMIERVMR